MDLGDELDQARHLPLGDHVDLQVDARAPVGSGGLAVLRDEHECRQEDGFEGDDHGQQAKGERVEAAPGSTGHIQRDPQRKPRDVQDDEGHAAAERRDAVGNAFAARLRRRCSFEACNLFDGVGDVVAFAREQRTCAKGHARACPEVTWRRSGRRARRVMRRVHRCAWAHSSSATG